MTTNRDIDEAVSVALREKTGFTCYSNEVTEGLELPCFFLKSTLAESQSAGLKTVRKTVRVIINFFGRLKKHSTIRDEDERDKMAATLYDIFFRTLKVKDRFFLITDQSDALAGENQDILIFSFNLEFFDSVEEEENEDITKITVETKIKQKKG
jgi:hypothetical protein